MFGQLKSNLDISDSVAGLKLEKSGGKHGGGECGEAVVEFFCHGETKSGYFIIEERRSASELAEVQEGKGDADLGYGVIAC